jgi:hypothetical protein
MTPNDVIISIYNDLVNISKFVTKNHELQHDLTSEVVLSLLDKGDRLVEIYNNEDIYNYSFRIAYIKWNMNNGVEIGNKNNSCFKSIYRDYDLINSVDVDDLKYKLPNEEESTQLSDVYKAIELLPNSLKKQTIKKYISLGCNLREMADEVEISRFHLKKVINEILIETKQIYERIT